MAFPGTYNFNLYRGDQYDFVINPKNPNGTPFDLTGYTSLFAVATERGNPAALVGFASASVDSSGIDKVTCKIPSLFSSQLSGTSYVYDIEVLNSSSSTVYTLLTGNITVTQDVTRTGQG